MANVVVEHSTMLPTLDDDVAWKRWDCPHCGTSFVYDRLPESPVGYWWTWEAWMSRSGG